MTDRVQLEAETWEGWVGSRSPAEFLAESARQGHTTIEAAVDAYVADLPGMFPEEWAAAAAAGETAAIPGLLAGHLRRQLLGIAEIAALLGERRETVAQWRVRGKLPPPTQALAMGPVWSLEALQPWLQPRLDRRQAQVLTDALNAYMAAHTAAEADPWGDVIFTERWTAQVDDEATSRADRSGMSDTVILHSGWAVVWDAPAHEWQVRACQEEGGGGMAVTLEQVREWRRAGARVDVKQEVAAVVTDIIASWGDFHAVRDTAEQGVAGADMAIIARIIADESLSCDLGAAEEALEAECHRRVTARQP